MHTLLAYWLIYFCMLLILMCRHSCRKSWIFPFFPFFLSFAPCSMHRPKFYILSQPLFCKAKQAELLVFPWVLSRLLVAFESFPAPVPFVPLHLNSVMRLLGRFLRMPCHWAIYYHHFFSLLVVPVLPWDSSYLPVSQAELFWWVIMTDKALLCVRSFWLALVWYLNR